MDTHTDTHTETSPMPTTSSSTSIMVTGPHTEQRQTCWLCIGNDDTTTVGTLPDGTVRPYYTEHYNDCPDGRDRRWHVCARHYLERRTSVPGPLEALQRSIVAGLVAQLEDSDRAYRQDRFQPQPFTTQAWALLERAAEQLTGAPTTGGTFSADGGACVDTENGTGVEFQGQRGWLCTDGRYYDGTGRVSRYSV